MLDSRRSSQSEFVPFAVESRGLISRNALQFLCELGSWRPGMFEHLRFVSTDFRCGATFQFCFAA